MVNFLKSFDDILPQNHPVFAITNDLLLSGTIIYFERSNSNDLVLNRGRRWQPNLTSSGKKKTSFKLFSDPKRKHELPISRIRRAMKSNDQVKMVSAHSMVLFSKAIEMVILELTLRAWMQADQVKRPTLKRNDFARAIRDKELFDFLSDIVPLQTHKNQFQVEEENDGQGNEFYAAYQMIQPDNIPYQFQVEEVNDVQGSKFHLANQMVQLHNVPLQQLYQFQVGGAANDGQGNGFDPTYQIVQPNNIPVQAEANDGQGNKFHPIYQMGQSNNFPVSAVYPG